VSAIVRAGFGVQSEEPKGTARSLNEAALTALRAMLRKKHEKTDLVFHQADGTPWKSILESFLSLLKKCRNWHTQQTQNIL
jgi:hypothetical protein